MNPSLRSRGKSSVLAVFHPKPTQPFQRIWIRKGSEAQAAVPTVGRVRFNVKVELIPLFGTTEPEGKAAKREVKEMGK